MGISEPRFRPVAVEVFDNYRSHVLAPTDFGAYPHEVATALLESIMSSGRSLCHLVGNSSLTG